MYIRSSRFLKTSYSTMLILKQSESGQNEDLVGTRELLSASEPAMSSTLGNHEPTMGLQEY